MANLRPAATPNPPPAIGGARLEALRRRAMRPNWFLACPLPAAAGWQRAAAGAPAELRRFAPEDLHLTVAFLGACAPEAALRSWGSLADLRVGPIRITAAAWRELGPRQRPSAYGLSLAEGEQEMAALLLAWGPLAMRAAGLEAAAEATGARRALPHVTLLRPPRREAEALREPMRGWMAGAPLPPGAARISELALYTWSDQRQQRLFRVVERRSLAGVNTGGDPAPSGPGD